MTRFKRLPPEPTNLLRAAWAEAAVQAFMSETGTDREDALGDLLCDLMHWALANRVDFLAHLSRAFDHFVAETTGDE